MKSLTLFVALCGSALCASIVANPRVARAQNAGPTWITDVTIVSPEKLDQVERGSVLIENGRIVRVVRTAEPPVPAGATVVSGHGQFLIPGLIDSHVHLASVPGMELGPDPTKSAMITAYRRQLPRSYLYFGYTTVVDLAVVDDTVLDNFKRAPLHPDLYDCGQSLPVANGYPMSFAPPEWRFVAFPNFLYDSAQASRIPSQYRPEDHSPAVAVARVKRAGGICIKTYFERGFGRDRNLPVISPELFAETRRAASQAGLVLMVHANSFEAQRFAVAGEADVIAHGMWNWGNLDTSSTLPAPITSLLDEIAAKRIGYQPTIQVMQGIRVYFDPRYLELKSIPKVIPADMLAWFKSPAGQWFKSELSDGRTPDAERREGLDHGPIRHVRQVVAYLAGRNANFLFGTDTPSSPTYGNLPGLNGYLEMQQLRQAGMTLRQIFEAATLSNAREFKLDSLGTIEPGKIANLVLLKKSPLESVDAYDTITMIWLHGKAVARDGLVAPTHS